MRRGLTVVAFASGALVLTGCGTTPLPLPTIFDRAATERDAIPVSFTDDYEQSRLVSEWETADVYLALPAGKRVVCLVVIVHPELTSDERATAACADEPPLEMGVQGAGSFRYDLDVPEDAASEPAWEAIGPDVYAHR